MALAVALVITLITLATVYAFWTHLWWLPVDISVHGPRIDHQFALTLVICGVIFVAAQMGLAIFIWKYRDRGDGRTVTPSRGHPRAEVAWTAAAAVVFIGLNFLSYRVWARMHFTGAAPGTLKVEVQGEQFAYYFRYPGPDGKFGAIHVDKIDDATANYFGLDRRRDPAAKDDIVTATLGIPVNRPIELLLRTKDVGHSFYIPELRIQQDMVPGMEIPVHFTATAEALKHHGGRYEIVCTQLCGLGHYKMRAFLQVMSEQDFEEWLNRQAAEQ